MHIAEEAAHALVRKRGAVGGRPLPASQGKSFAGVVQIPARRAVVVGQAGRPVSHVRNVSLFGNRSLGMVESPQPCPLARGPVRVPSAVEIDNG